MTIAMLGVAIVAVAIGAIAIRSWASPGLEPAPPAPIAGRDAAFYAFAAPRLAAVRREGGELAALGERRSRNLLAIQAGQRSIEALLDDLDGYAAERGVPPRFAAAWATFEEATRDLRRGIADARRAFRRLDWDAIATAVDTFETGLAGTERASQLLDRAAGVPHRGTPPADRAGAGDGPGTLRAR